MSSPPPSESSEKTSAGMHAFVTVGSTRFDALVQRVLSNELLDVLHSRGYSSLTVQCGHSDFDASHFKRSADGWIHHAAIDVSIWRFRPTLQEEYRKADLIIGHAGSGTIIDVLRMGKPLIAIPNPTLLHNHQEELASALATLGHLKTATVASLPFAIKQLDSARFVPFPAFDGSRFRELLDEEMGYIEED